MLIDRQLIAPDAPHVKAIADNFNLLPVLASAWLEMMLQKPHGTETVHKRLEDCVEAAARDGNVEAGEALRCVVCDFDKLCETCAALEAPEAPERRI